MKKNHPFQAIAVVACILTVVVLLPALAQAAPSALPPRPTLAPTLTPTPTPTPSPTLAPPPQPGPAGGFIELQAQFATTWPSSGLEWQDLWTVVQWQDPAGKWHDVEGWQGGFDRILAGDVGGKVWWVFVDSFGEGPFRWLVYTGKGGALLATSESFNLPKFSGDVVTVEVTLEP